jgi:hypothetical protein
VTSAANRSSDSSSSQVRDSFNAAVGDEPRVQGQTAQRVFAKTQALDAVVVHERVPEVEVRETRKTRSQRVDAVVADISVRERHRLELR